MPPKRSPWAARGSPPEWRSIFSRFRHLSKTQFSNITPGCNAPTQPVAQSLARALSGTLHSLQSYITRCADEGGNTETKPRPNLLTYSTVCRLNGARRTGQTHIAHYRPSKVTLSYHSRKFQTPTSEHAVIRVKLRTRTLRGIGI